MFVICVFFFNMVSNVFNRFDLVLFFVNFFRMFYFYYYKLFIFYWELWFIEMGSFFMVSNILEFLGMVYDKGD